MTERSPKVFAALSGGVDSSVAALLLTEQGFAVSGVHLRLLHNEDLGMGQESGCCSLADAEDARQVAYRIGIPFYVFDFSEAFHQTVVRRFVDGYRAGETPNPCMDCNRFIKWGELLRRAEILGCEFIATGHYARVRQNRETGRWMLLRGRDQSKDQSYFLSRLTQHQLSRTLLPLGELTKPEVRALAEQRELVTARKRDSQDLCFAPDGDYATFVERMSGEKAKSGNILDEKGNIIGEHQGILLYTLGQRKGLRIAAGSPVYVCAKDPAANTVTVGPEERLYTQCLTAREANWIAVEKLDKERRVMVQTRYHQREQSGTAVPRGNGSFQVRFDQPQRAVTPGQTVVLYEGDSVLGAGTIDRTE